jgi:multidrug efflux pump subunit AcrA (membrane-fusion protein)
MKHKILSGVWIGICAVLTLASLVGIGLIWGYRTPLTEKALSQLEQIDTQLSQAQTALGDAQTEIERTLRIVDSAEQTLASLSDELAQAKVLFDEFDQTMGEKLIPGLESSRDRLNSVRSTLEDLRTKLEEVNSLPFVDLNLPGDELLGNLIETVNSMDSQISRMQGLAEKASTFAGDVSYLMGGDLSETRQHLEDFLTVVQQYNRKVTGWRAQIATLRESLPGWINTAAIVLTVFLLWFAVSQFGLILHGLTVWRGGNPLAVLRMGPLPVSPREASSGDKSDELQPDLEEASAGEVGADDENSTDTKM